MLFLHDFYVMRPFFWLSAIVQNSQQRWCVLASSLCVKAVVKAWKKIRSEQDLWLLNLGKSRIWFRCHSLLQMNVIALLFTTIKEYSALIFIIKCNIALTMNVRTNEVEYRRTVYFFVAYKSAHILIWARVQYYHLKSLEFSVCLHRLKPVRLNY